MTTREELQARFKAFLDKNYPCCGVPGCCGEEEEAKALVDIAYEMMRPLTLVEIAERDHPGRMSAARKRMREEAREARVQENRIRAEHFRRAQEAAWEEGMLSQFEADLLGKPTPENPHSKKDAGQ